MNQYLTIEIVKHILSNFGILPASHVDLSKSKSLKDKEFLLAE
jgi:hypothetical protein